MLRQVLVFQSPAFVSTATSVRFCKLPVIFFPIHMVRVPSRQWTVFHPVHRVSVCSPQCLFFHCTAFVASFTRIRFSSNQDSFPSYQDSFSRHQDSRFQSTGFAVPIHRVRFFQYQELVPPVLRICCSSHQDSFSIHQDSFFSSTRDSFFQSTVFVFPVPRIRIPVISNHHDSFPQYTVCVFSSPQDSFSQSPCFVFQSPGFVFQLPGMPTWQQKHAETSHAWSCARQEYFVFLVAIFVFQLACVCCRLVCFSSAFPRLFFLFLRDLHQPLTTTRKYTLEFIISIDIDIIQHYCIHYYY